jgi:hypothetical protein
MEELAAMGVYNWIREGVRQAVLLGFSDAIEEIGVPTQADNLNPHLLGVLRQRAPAVLEQARPLPLAPSGAAGRKRLGKSLAGPRPAVSNER